MFSREFHTLVRRLEADLYAGPETSEQVFDRDEHYHTEPVRRRSVPGSSRTGGAENRPELCTYRYDRSANKIDVSVPE